MIEACRIFGIYPEAIQKAYDAATSALIRFKANDACFKEAVEDELKEIGNFDNITDSLIYAIYNTTEWYLEKNGVTLDRIDYFVNGNDSHFYIDKEEVR